MTALEIVAASQAETADIAARILRLRDHLVGEKALENPTIEQAPFGGVLGTIQDQAMRNRAINAVAISAIAEVEAALGIV